MKKKIVFALGVAMLIGTSAVCSKTAINLRAEEEETSSIVESSESVEQEQASSSNEVDFEKVAEELKDFYESKVRDTAIFGMSIGTMLGLAIDALAVLIKAKRDGKFHQMVSVSEKQAKEDIFKVAELVKMESELWEKGIESLENKVEVLYAKVESDEAMRKDIEKAVEAIKTMSSVNTKISIIADALMKIVENDEDIKSGISSEIARLLEEVK